MPIYLLRRVKDIVRQIKLLDDSQLENTANLRIEMLLKKLLKFYLIVRTFFFFLVIPFIAIDTAK